MLPLEWSSPPLGVLDRPCHRPHPNLQLPVELLQLILSYVSPPTLVVLLRVSRTLHILALPGVYREIRIDLSTLVNPLFNKRITPPTRVNRHRARIVSQLAQSSAPLTLGRVSPYTPYCTVSPPSLHRIPPPDRFSHTTYLTITSHTLSSSTICQDYPSLLMPLLHTLRIIPGAHEDNLDICRCLHSYDSPVLCAVLPCSCALLSHLRPRRLILGSSRTGLTGTGMGLWRSRHRHFPPSWVKELEIYVGTRSGIEEGPGLMFLYWLPATAQRLTLIVEPEARTWQTDGWWRYRTLPGPERPPTPIERFWDRLALAAAGDAGVVTIVGLELVDPWLSLVSAEEAQGEVGRRLGRRLLGRGKTEAAADKRVKELLFVDREVWDEQGLLEA